MLKVMFVLAFVVVGGGLMSMVTPATSQGPQAGDRIYTDYGLQAGDRKYTDY